MKNVQKLMHSTDGDVVDYGEIKGNPVEFSIEFLQKVFWQCDTIGSSVIQCTYLVH